MAKLPTFKYKNISGQTQTLMNYGEIKPGETIELTITLDNPNLQQQAQGDTFIGVVPVSKQKRNT